MKPLTRENLIPYGDYDRQRQAVRQRVIELKRQRRMSVGDRVTLLFENRDTIQFQVQEMIRAERILDPGKVQEELDGYNAMLPAEGELSATLFIELTDNERLKEGLDAFKGIDHGKTVCLKAGPHTIYAEFEGGHSNEEKISAVHFLKFRPDARFREALASDTSPVAIGVVHAAYQEEAPVPEDLRREWLADLRPDQASNGGL